MEQSDYDSGTSDDIIIFKSGRYNKETKWQFPQVKQCPTIRCNEKFPSRALTIKHYRKQHAKKFTLCQACDKPVRADKFVNHKQTDIHRSSVAFKTRRVSAQVDLNLFVTLLNIILIWIIQLYFF